MRGVALCIRGLFVSDHFSIHFLPEAIRSRSTALLINAGDVLLCHTKQLQSGTEDKIRANLNKYEELRLIAECHSRARRYPAIKSWFLEMYPEVVSFGTVEEKAKILQIGEKRAS